MSKIIISICRSRCSYMYYFSSSFHLSSNYRYVKICLGKRDLVHELLKTHWGMVFFTGGENAAKHICKAAAEQLSPVCMELGGKNPVYITKNANLETVFDEMETTIKEHIN